MRVSALESFLPNVKITEPTNLLSFEIKESSIGKTKSNFTDIINRALNDVNDVIAERNQKVFDYYTGKNDDIHEVTIAQANYDLVLSLASTVATKLTTAYQTLMNLQV